MTELPEMGPQVGAGGFPRESHLDNLPEEYEAISPKKALVKQDLSGTLKSPLNYFWLL